MFGDNLSEGFRFQNLLAADPDEDDPQRNSQYMIGFNPDTRIVVGLVKINPDDLAKEPA
jgi:hypothetical protein